jgi:hypothetical protein
LDGYKYHRRARRPRLSHGSLDWQPNDHLGRSWSRPHLFEHRRQILRGCTESDTDAYSDRDSDSHSYGYIHADTNGHVHTYAYSNIDTYGHSHADSNSNTYFDTETFTDAEIRANAQAACHAATAPVALP